MRSSLRCRGTPRSVPLGLWGLPPTVIDAVARHHDEVTEATSPIARAVVMAEQIVDEVTDDPRPSGEEVEQMRELVALRSPHRQESESKERAS